MTTRVAEPGSAVETLNFLPIRPLPLTLPVLPPDRIQDRGEASWGEGNPPEEGAFWLGGDLQAIKEAGGHALHAQSFDPELYRMVCGHLDVPYTVGVGRVGVWVVGAAEDAPWSQEEAPTGCGDSG